MSVLVAFATKHGATAQIAERVAKVLAGRGLTVECRRARDVDSLDGVSALVLGGALYAGSWPREAAALVERVTKQRPGLPAWAFSSGPLGDPLKPAERPGPADATANRLALRDHAVFAGAMDRSKLSLPERGLMAAMRVADGDYRDWEEIEAWAERVASEIETGQAPPAEG